jgi:Zn-dependent protease
MSFRVGRLFGIDIRVHILFLIWIGFRALQSGGSTTELMFLALLFGIVLLHELGHCFGARSVGGDADNILMWPLGGLAFAHAPMTPWAQFVTVAAGPAVNLVFCLFSGAFLNVSAGGWVVPISPFDSFGPAMFALPGWYSYIAIFYHVNLWLLAFNLLPIYPLDGGQLLQCALWPFLGLRRAMELACQIGLVGCIGLGLWGLSERGGGMLLFIAIFGGFTCYQRLQMLKVGMIVDERIKYAPVKVQNQRSWFSRMFGSRKPSTRKAQPPNPNPGAWDTKQADRRRQTVEVDRILAKVSREGIQSLSYVEQQTLESASRQRREEEREFDRQTRL